MGDPNIYIYVYIYIHMYQITRLKRDAVFHHVDECKEVIKYYED